MGDVATAHARLASGWLAGLCREGVEPSGSLRKVSELLHLFPLSWIYPDAMALPQGAFLSHRLHAEYEAIVDAACKAWRRLTAEGGRIKSLCTYPWIPKVKT
jgi:hypothetical protein